MRDTWDYRNPRTPEEYSAECAEREERKARRQWAIFSTVREVTLWFAMMVLAFMCGVVWSDAFIAWLQGGVA